MDEHSKRLERIEAKIDDSADHLASIDVTLGVQSIQLRDHIRRTTLLEQELRPIRKHVNMVQGALKLITLAAAMAAIVEFILHR